MSELVMPATFSEAPLKEPSSASLPNFSSRKAFKSNNSAGFLRKRLSVDLTQNSETRASINLLPLKNKSETTPECSDACTEQERCDFNNKADKHTKSLEIQSSDQRDVLADSAQLKDLKEKYFKIMVIGSRNIGKHNFVNSLFSTDDSACRARKQYFDLITKVITDEEYIKRYNFWLKELSDVEKDYRYIVDVYYKTCTVFFLIYNPEDPNSMAMVERELSLLRNTHQNLDNCKIVLLANKKRDDGDSQNNISVENIELIKNKYSDKIYFETTQGPEVNDRLLKLIESTSK